MPEQQSQLSVGAEVLAVKIWKDGKSLKHWSHPRLGKIVAINLQAKHSVIVEFSDNERIGFEPLEVWPAQSN